MIVATFIKSYKIYKNIKFVPLSNTDNFTALIGQNGTGKSSVLEALDSYFNNREWNINKQAKSGGGIVYINTPYVAPVFLIEKAKIRQSNAAQKSYYEMLELISSYLWSVDRKSIVSSSPEISEFISFRDELTTQVKIEDYFLVVIGKRYEQQNKVYIGPFHHQDSFLKHIAFESQETETEDKSGAYLKEDEYIQEKFKNIVDYTIQKYSFVYIPSDIDVSDYTKLETDDMQKLMDKSIKDIIQNTIKQNNLDEINKSLGAFIDEISEKLKEYTYKKPTGGKANITMPDLVATIIREFFSIRFLTKKLSGEFIQVSNLSSGEKRKSLIDLAFAFLYKSERKEHVILAIDEPEISLHVSACFDQFEKLAKLADDGNQIMITTHWYGFLPVAQSGTAIFMNIEDDKVISELYELGNYREKIVQARRKEKGKVPYDVYLKSNYDLVQSIVLSIRKPNSYKWILCEGKSEKIYFSNIFRTEIELGNIRILPLGGCGEIIKLYEYLEVALDDKDMDITGSVLGIIDTDEQKTKFIPKKKIKKLSFKRLYFKDDSVKLIDIDSVDVANVTEIEHSLRADLYRKIIGILAPKEITTFVNEGEMQKGAIWSYNFMDLKTSQIQKIKNYFDSDEGNKAKFAEAYVKDEEFDAKKEPIHDEIMKYL